MLAHRFGEHVLESFRLALIGEIHEERLRERDGGLVLDAFRRKALQQCIGASMGAEIDMALIVQMKSDTEM